MSLENGPVVSTDKETNTNDDVGSAAIHSSPAGAFINSPRSGKLRFSKGAYPKKPSQQPTESEEHSKKRCCRIS